jgi:integrase
LSVALNGTVIRLGWKSPQDTIAQNIAGKRNMPGLWRLNGWRTNTEQLWKRARGLKNREEEMTKVLSRKEAEEFYANALTKAAKVAGRSVSSSFEDSMRKTFDEFKAFLARIGQGLTVETARGLDIVAFIEGEWKEKHQNNFRTTVGDGGQKMASASAIKGVIQHLVKSYSIMGRNDTNNPAKEESVQSYREGYRNELHDKGVREKRAKTFKESKVNDLIHFLDEKISASSGIELCVALMDRTAVLYLWGKLGARGKECGELEFRQIDREDQTVLPGWSKTVQQEPSARIDLTGEGGSKTCLGSSAQLLGEMERQEIPLVRGFLFRPQTKNRRGFEDESLKSAAMRKRIQKHLKDADLFEGETLHSFRRSAVQNAAEIEGYDVAKLMLRGRWSSYAAFRLYVEEIETKFARRSYILQ